MYIYKRKEWPEFVWDQTRLALLLAETRHLQGRLLGRMEVLGFQLREEATLQTLTQDVVKTSEIEGEKLDEQQVRSSLARHMGMDIGALPPTDRYVEGIVEVMLDAGAVVFLARGAVPDRPQRNAAHCGWRLAHERQRQYASCLRPDRARDRPLRSARA
jgi:hypothetical protein